MYPRFMYHKELCPDGKAVKSAEEHRKLGKGWTHSPSFEPGPGDEVDGEDQAPVGASSEQPEPSGEMSEAPKPEKKSKKEKK